MMRALIASLALLLVIASCSSDGEEPANTADPDAESATDQPTEPDPDSPETTGSGPTGSEPAEGAPSTVPEVSEVPSGIELGLEPLIQLEFPTHLAARPGSDSLYVAELAGRVLELEVDSDGQISSEPRVVLDITDRVSTAGEQGLLAITFSPDGDRLYATFGNLNGGDSLVSWALGPDGTATPESELGHIDVPQPTAVHNGAQIVFGPDGYLYYALGDGGPGGDPEGNGQNLSTPLGSILRIDPDPVSGGYTVPPDNPFVDEPGAAPEIWAYGMRHPWRFSFDSETGDLWIGDIGQDDREEINFLPASDGAGDGVNLGWNVFEGTLLFTPSDAPGHVPPLVEYTQLDGRCSVIGGFVYHGSAIPSLDGVYLYTDLCDGVIRGVIPGIGSAALATAPTGSAISFGQGPDREIYLIETDSTVSRLVAQSS